MTAIRNAGELRMEIKRLRTLTASQEKQIKTDIENIGDSLKPGNLLLSFFSSVTGIRLEKKEFLRDGIAYGLSLLIRKFILKTEMKLESKLAEWADSFFQKVRDFMKSDKQGEDQD